jgi:hypothetical protein
VRADAASEFGGEVGGKCESHLSGGHIAILPYIGNSWPRLDNPLPRMDTGHGWTRMNLWDVVFIGVYPWRFENLLATDGQPPATDGRG